jgi:hypothetical protein
MTFWKTATKEQKLAQIDGGIECGMTARQVAMNCGTPSINVYRFAERNNRSLPAKKAKLSETLKIALARSQGKSNDVMPEAFDIFGAKERKWEMEL